MIVSKFKSLLIRYATLNFKGNSGFSYNLFMQTGVINAVAKLQNTIGYAGMDSVDASQYYSTNATNCRVRVAYLINKAGQVISPSVESAQSAVTSSAQNLLSASLCPGFGMCAEIADGADSNVWPITALTVSVRDIGDVSVENRLAVENS